MRAIRDIRHIAANMSDVASTVQSIESGRSEKQLWPYVGGGGVVPLDLISIA